MKKRSSRSSTVDKVVNIDQLNSNPPVKSDCDDSGYGAEKDRLKMKSFSCEDLLAIGSTGSCSQNRRRQSTANVSRINTKSTCSTSSSTTSEEQISRCAVRPRLCSVNIDGQGQCQLIKDDYNEATFESEPVKHHNRKTSVHLKVYNLRLYRQCPSYFNNNNAGFCSLAF